MAFKAPSGYQMFELPSRGGRSADIYNQLALGAQGAIPDILKQKSALATGSPEQFAQLEAPALRQFQQQIAPGIASRYAGSGIGASSGMQNSIAGAGADLAERLQAQRLGIMHQSMNDILGLSNFLLSNPESQFGLVEGQPKTNWLGAIAPFALGAAGAGLGFMGGGPAGALTGLKLGSGLGSGFSQGYNR